MISLLKSERFQTEYASFKKNIDAVTNPAAKAELETLLRSLVSEVNSLDMQHQEISSVKNLVTTNNDIKGKIAEIRKKIDTKIEECKKAGVL